MASRIELDDLLRTYIPNVYFQPPSNFQMVYPCIVYRKVASQSYGNDSSKRYSNNKIYNKIQEYSLMLIERDPDSAIADVLEGDMDYCAINQRYTTNNLHHTTLTLYY